MEQVKPYTTEEVYQNALKEYPKLKDSGYSKEEIVSNMLEKYPKLKESYSTEKKDIGYILPTQPEAKDVSSKFMSGVKGLATSFESAKRLFGLEPGYDVEGMNQYRTLIENSRQETIKIGGKIFNNPIKEGWNDFVQMTPSMIAGTALSVANPAVGLGFWAMQGAGDTYSSMKQLGVDDKLSKPLSIMAGIPYAMIEKFQIGKIVPLKMFKEVMEGSVKTTAKQLAKEFGKDWSENVGQEVFQQAVQSTALEVGIQMDDNLEKNGIDKATRNIVSDSIQAGLQSALPMVFALAPSKFVKGGASIIRNAQETKQERENSLNGKIQTMQELQKEITSKAEVSQDPLEKHKLIKQVIDIDNNISDLLIETDNQAKEGNLIAQSEKLKTYKQDLKNELEISTDNAYKMNIIKQIDSVDNQINKLVVAHEAMLNEKEQVPEAIPEVQPKEVVPSGKEEVQTQEINLPEVLSRIDERKITNEEVNSIKDTIATDPSYLKDKGYAVKATNIILDKYINEEELNQTQKNVLADLYINSKNTTPNKTYTNIPTKNQLESKVESNTITEEAKTQPRAKEAQSVPSLYSVDGESYEGTQFKVQPHSLIALNKLLTDKDVEIRVRERIGRKEETRGVFKLKDGSIELKAELFKTENRRQLYATLFHEFGHWLDIFPEKTLRRNNVLGKLINISNFMKNSFGGINITNPELKKEMYELSKKWRPYNEQEASPSFKKYRQSANEIYADFISALFNDPEWTKENAPRAYKEFWKNINNKPVAKDIIELQATIFNNSPRDTIEENLAEIDRKFISARQIYEDKHTKKKILSMDSAFNIFNICLSDRNYVTLKEVAKLKAMGKEYDPNLDPRLLLSEMSYVDTELYAYTGEMSDTILRPLRDNGIEDNDFGKFLFFKRVIGKDSVADLRPDSEFEAGENDITNEGVENLDRTELANPWFYNKESATIALEILKEQMGEEKYSKMEEISKKQAVLFNKVLKKALDCELITEEIYNRCKNNDVYVTFAVIDYIDGNIDPNYKSQVGTTKAIGNPFYFSHLKMLSTIKASELNKNKKEIVGFFTSSDELYKANNVTEKPIIPATKTKYGVMNPPKGYKVIGIYENGEYRQYYAEDFVAESFVKMNTGKLGEAWGVISEIMYSLPFRNLVTKWSSVFSIVTNPVKDYKSNYKNIGALVDAIRQEKGFKTVKKVTVLKLIQKYWKWLNIIKNNKELFNSTLEELVRIKATRSPELKQTNYLQRDDVKLESSFVARLAEMDAEERELNLFQKSWETAKSQTQGIDNAPLRALATIGSMLNEVAGHVSFVSDIVSKMVGYEILKETEYYSEKELGFQVRTNVGTPDYRKKGKFTPVTNVIFPFSNIFAQDLARSINILKDPATRKAWIYRTVLIEVIPMLSLMAWGYTNKKNREMYDKMNEKDKWGKTNLILGEDIDGAVKYLSVPNTDNGKVLSGIIYYLIKSMSEKDAGILLQSTNIISQGLPSPDPIFDFARTGMDFAKGKNPYDYDNGRTIIDKEIFESYNQFDKFKQLVAWNLNNYGLGFMMSKKKESTVLQTALRITGFNRVIKTSTYGEVEAIKELVGKERAMTATEAQNMKKIADKHVNNLIDNKSTVKSQHSFSLVEANKIVKQVTGKSGTKKAKNLINYMYKQYKIKTGETTSNQAMAKVVRLIKEKKYKEAGTSLNAYKNTYGKSDSNYQALKKHLKRVTTK